MKQHARVSPTPEGERETDFHHPRLLLIDQSPFLLRPIPPLQRYRLAGDAGFDPLFLGQVRT
jgi:hypothetical protein